MPCASHQFHNDNCQLCFNDKARAPGSPWAYVQAVPYGPENDLVKHPHHYTNGRHYEPRKVIRDWGLNFNLGRVVNYISRAGRKNGESKLRTLEKAIEYLQWEIEEVRIEEQDAATAAATRKPPE